MKKEQMAGGVDGVGKGADSEVEHACDRHCPRHREQRGLSEKRRGDERQRVQE